MRLSNEYESIDINDFIVMCLHTMNSFMREKESGYTACYVKNKDGKYRKMTFPGFKE